MYTIVEQPPEFEKISALYKTCVQELLKDLAPITALHTIERGEIVFNDAQHSGHLYLIREGNLTYSLQNRALFFFDEGDLIGVEQQCGQSQAQVQGDFAVKVDAYLLTDVLASIFENMERQHVWNRFLIYQLHLFAMMLSTQSSQELIAQPDMLNFQAGETIVREGESGDDVYTLVDGHAEVFVGDVKVGEILRDEIFGVLAAVTKSKRTASVVATEKCLVLALPNVRFLELMESRPGTVKKMIEDMARTIVDLNKRIVGHKHAKMV